MNMMISYQELVRTFLKNNDVYLTLDDKKSDEFILKQNLDALRNEVAH